MHPARKVLIPEDQPGYRDFLRRLVENSDEIQVCVMAVNASPSPESVVAAELRAILDGCPICDGGFRGHSYFMLGSVVLDKDPESLRHLALFLQCMRDSRWQELLAFRQFSRSKDTAVAYAFRCDKGRVGTLMVLSPADPALPDEPAQFTILSAEEGRKLMATVKPGQWLPLRPVLHPQSQVPSFRSAV